MKGIRSTQSFPIIVEKDDGGFFVATNPAIPGCYSQGKNMEEALLNVREATEACLAEQKTEDVAGTASSVSVHVITV
ncbi:MAG: type II toxin-antitoxin system HicB family antitoxin [bacterium]|nr:type II toxin-antitoxin system HicB family antitoxin [bacterium]